MTSLHGHKYFLTIVDDHTRYVWVFPMVSKAKTQPQMKPFVVFVERQFETKVKTIRSDNGVELSCINSIFPLA